MADKQISELATATNINDNDLFVLQQNGTAKSLNGYVLKNELLTKRFGFRRKKSESSPTARIEYLYDAVGMTPSYMDFNNDKFIWGDWKLFVESFIRPVMLKDNGTVDYELNHEDQTKKLDGTASDISNSSYSGSAMVEFGKAYKWVKRYEADGYDYVIFANKQLDEDYHAYAHTAENGTVKDAFYWGMFNGVNVSNKLRSLVGSPMVSQDREAEITYAKNVGSGWYTAYWSGQNYINDLLTLICKSDNVQAAFGTGSSAPSANGALKSKGCFYGTSFNSTVKALWIENPWGDTWQSLAGIVVSNDRAYVRNTKPYCDTPVTNADYSSYLDCGALPLTGWLCDCTVSENGTIPKTVGASDVLYYCDYIWRGGSNCYPIIGGSGVGTKGGSRATHFGVTASNAATYICARPSFVG